MLDNNFLIPLLNSNNNCFLYAALTLSEFLLRMFITFFAVDESFIYSHFSIKFIRIRRFFGLLTQPSFSDSLDKNHADFCMIPSFFDICVEETFLGGGHHVKEAIS